jgi:RNA polymerase sigma-70 factor (ECF subfamily)
LKEEFLEIVSNYQGILHKVNLIYFKNQADREDNFQEIVYQLWKSFPALKKNESLGSWIYAVSINTSISRIRNKSRIEYREDLPEILDNRDLFEELSIDETSKLLLNAIHQLNETNKSVILLFLEEKSYEEIAEILGITVSNVGVRINRAKELLRKNLNHLNHGK